MDNTSTDVFSNKWAAYVAYRRSPIIPTQYRHHLQKITRTGVLFHGSRYMNHILATNKLSVDAITGFLSLTRCPDVAAHHASNGPRDWDDGRGAILVIDYQRLRQRHRIKQFNDGFWGYRGEAEEYLDQSIEPISDVLVACVRLDELQPGLGVMPPRTAEPGRFPVRHPVRCLSLVRAASIDGALKLNWTIDA